MNLTFFQKTALAIAGLTASCIAAFILVAPHAFYAGYGVELGTNASLLSELRAPAAGLLASGILMLAGIMWTAWTRPAVVVAFIVFVGFPAGRIMGLILDGMPSGGILGALAIEILIGLLLFAAFGWRRRAAMPGAGVPG